MVRGAFGTRWEGAPKGYPGRDLVPVVPATSEKALSIRRR